MKTLSITCNDVTRESLLKMAEEIPGAWIGIRIAAYLLILDGWKSSHVGKLFDVSRWTVVKWIRKADQEGIEAIKDKPRIGRPTKFNEEVQKKLEDALSKSPKEFGISRVRWDGIVVVEYLKRFHHITIHVRHAQRWIRNLGYSLRQPIYRFVQATNEGVEEFRSEIKKTSVNQRKRGERGNSV